MISTIRSHLAASSRSEFARNAFWFTALSAGDRVIALVQTILISRVLGITEYGVYGLLFGTIGFAASVIGLQMGLTATVFVSKYRLTDKAKATAVISIVGRFGWIVAGLLVVGAAPFTGVLSRSLLDSDAYQTPVMLGLVFVGASILSGVQDGVAQGFEAFGVLARVKIVASLLTALMMFPAAAHFGLKGVVGALLVGLLVKYVVLQRVISQSKVDAGLPAEGSGVSFRGLVSEFAFPSMAVSLLLGFVTWLGTFMLSRQAAGFDSVAVVSTGLQWRGPVLLLAASLGGVAVPAFSRLDGRGDSAGSRRLRRILLAFNLSVAAVATIGVIAGSGFIMNVYGAGFIEGRLAFCLIVLSTVPTVVTNVYMQELVGGGRMWRVFWLHCPHAVVWFICLDVLIPRFQGMGYALSMLAGTVTLLASALVAQRLDGRRPGAIRSSL